MNSNVHQEIQSEGTIQWIQQTDVGQVHLTSKEKTTHTANVGKEQSRSTHSHP